MIIARIEHLRPLLEVTKVIDLRREALMAQARGDCDTPLPMHLEVPAERGEVHVKASYRRGGSTFVLKMATTFPNNLGRGLSTGNGMMLLASAETGAPVALLEDGGQLTDLRTAAAAAMTARELGRHDTALGILGSGIQARLCAELHAAVFPLEEVWVWGRTPARVAHCCDDIRRRLPGVRVEAAASPAAVAAKARLIVTATASREPLLVPGDVGPRTHVSAIGSDGPGKQELDPQILRHASLLLVDSRTQCVRLGELQHAPDQAERAVEIGAFCAAGMRPPADGITVCDFTGLGAQDLYIAEYCAGRLESGGIR